MKYRLQDLIDMEHFQSLQDRLNDIYSFPSSIIDNDGNILTATAWQDICMKFHRKNKECEKLCIKSDQYIKDHIHKADPAVTYRCPHGLVDNATPIIIDGVHCGNFFTGQFFLEEPDLNFFKVQARKYGFDEETYLEAVKKVPIWNQKQLDSYLFFIKGLISVISENGLKRLKEIETRKQIEKSRHFHQSIRQTAMDGFWLTDIKGRLLEVNDSYCRMSGYSENELLTMCITDLEAVENQKKFAKHMEKVGELGSDRFETRHRRKDGTIFDLEISVQYRNEDGGRCVVFLRDITNQKKTEKALQEGEEKYRSMMEAMDDSVYICSKNFRIEYMNTAMINKIGYDATGKVCYNVMNDLDEKCPWCIHEEVMKGKVIKTEVVSPRDNRIYHVSNSPIVHSHGQISKLTIFHDITEAKKSEERLLQAQKMESIGTLAGGIAHDFNNILFPIVGMSEILLEDLSPGSKEYANVLEILTAGKRGSDLVKQILSIGRQSENKMVPVRFHEILNEVLRLCRSTIPANIDITHEIQEDVNQVMANPTQLHQLSMNLITNAYHAVELTSGTIFLSFKEIKLGPDDIKSCFLEPGSYALLSVSDNGSGIPKALIDKIFEPYFTTKKKGKGTGLGLAMVHGIVKEHNGDIKVYSEVERGTTFNVYLPIIGKSDPVISDLTEGACAVGTERILIVDDEAAIANLEKQMLERLGYDVTTCVNSLDALAVFRVDPDFFDLVLTDMSMPQMTGNELARELLLIRSDIPIVLCTGFSERVDEDTATNMGLKGFLMKPVGQRDLARKIREILDKNRSFY